MSRAVHYAIPPSPPAEVLAELDAAAQVLDELTVRAISLRIDMDEQRRSPRIELGETSGARLLTPTQLFELLAG